MLATILDIRYTTLNEVLPIRHQVLWPDEPMENCIVSGDGTALHIAGYLGDEIVCVASIYQEETGRFRLRKFATLTQYQSQGIGSKVLNFIIAELKQKQAISLWCDARETAMPFYQRFGFAAISGRFIKKNKPYYKIECAL
ncbi:N-acetyltransferase [Marinomonas agarivorans]|nr:N-acetyltransferase [Marinomonas agarivorans]